MHGTMNINFVTTVSYQIIPNSPFYNRPPIRHSTLVSQSTLQYLIPTAWVNKPQKLLGGQPELIRCRFTQSKYLRLPRLALRTQTLRLYSPLSNISKFTFFPPLF